MIRHSVTIMRGCFGGCSFCSITEHEGRIIQSRSEGSILREIETIRDKTEGFTGIISDIGGPTANMYRMACKDPETEALCRRPSCVYPDICKNLNTSHDALISLYRKARAVPGREEGDGRLGRALRSRGARARNTCSELVEHHVGGYLKIAPEHTEAGPLSKMMKPGIGAYDRFKAMFDAAAKAAGKKYFLIPYFIAAHPGTTDEDMMNLALWLKRNSYRADQVQTFLPSPMALSTAMYHTRLQSAEAGAARRVRKGRRGEGAAPAPPAQGVPALSRPRELADAARGAEGDGPRRPDRARRAATRAGRQPPGARESARPASRARDRKRENSRPRASASRRARERLGRGQSQPVGASTAGGARAGGSGGAASTAPALAGSSAAATASSTRSSHTNASCSRTSSGMSSKSLRLRAGSMTRLTPARCGRDDLLLDAADRQHQPAQGDLAGHRRVGADGAVGHQRHQRHEHGDARARPVLRRRAGRHVNVDVGLLEPGRIDPEAVARFLTMLSAACALSFITSPSCPVRMSRPFPGVAVASMNRMSPPTGVQASPVATPGTLVRMATSSSKIGGAEDRAEVGDRDGDRPRLALGDPGRGPSQRPPDLALEVPDARLPRVVLDDRPERAVVDRGLVGLEPVRLHLARDEIAPRDLRTSRSRCSRAG